MDDKQIKKILWKGALKLVLIIPVMLGVLLLSAGRWDWWEAWAYTGLGLLFMLGSRFLVISRYPDLAVERNRAPEKENVKNWDRFLMPFTALIAPFLAWVVAGLDQRFGWSPDLPDWIQIIALIVIQAGSLIGTWAMLANRFFSSHVRIQTDRGHVVVTQGPYGIVRHPGYAGGLLSWLASPIFFSSIWVIIPTILAITASVIRTSKEDQTLRDELPGYTDYAREVKYRLLPGIW
jgi:protein-S-isoprenylcysteine O-methyltransferase Ste14